MSTRVIWAKNAILFGILLLNRIKASNMLKDRDAEIKFPPQNKSS